VEQFIDSSDDESIIRVKNVLDRFKDRYSKVDVARLGHDRRAVLRTVQGADFREAALAPRDLR
jgi:hypothetical protein